MAETQSKPPRFLFNRKSLGTMEVTQEVLDGLTIGGVSGAGVSAYEGNVWVSVLIAAGTVLLQLLKRGLSATLARAVPTNPINVSSTSTVSQPQPIEPVSTDLPENAETP